MITKIKHINSKKTIGNIINYHEKKIENGVGKLILDNTFSENKDERIVAFNEIIEGNKNVKNNFAWETSINFPHGENIKDEKFKEILNDYLKGMGYDNSPFVCYRHDDKTHQHYHIIVSHIDWEGKKIPQYNMFLKSQKLMRELEVKYNLRITEYNKNITNESLNTVEARKYYFSNALAKGMRSYNTKEYLNRNLNEEQKKIILDNYKKNNQLTNQQVSVLLGEKAEVIKNYLDEKGYFNKLLKDELYKKVNTVLSKSENKNDFFLNLEKENIYVRKIFDNNRVPHMVYGLKDVSFYIKDSELAKKFSYENIFNYKNEELIKESNNKNFDFDRQKKFIKNVAVRTLKESKNLKEFSEKLNGKGIELVTYQNQRGIYGIAFKSINISNAEIFKGSELDLSWKDVNAQLKFNEREGVKEIVIHEILDEKNNYIDNSYVPFIPTDNFSSRKNEAEDFLTKKKKKKRKNQERGI